MHAMVSVNENKFLKHHCHVTSCGSIKMCDRSCNMGVASFFQRRRAPWVEIVILSHIARREASLILVQITEGDSWPWQ